MKVDKRVVLSSAIVLGVAALIAGSTIAYFTDKDSATNNFTIGNVNITLY
jgi:predicted ribosomally synthesized peptide with SipW-like signal peptide